MPHLATIHRIANYASLRAVWILLLAWGLSGCGSTVTVRQVPAPRGTPQIERKVPRESPTDLQSWAGTDPVRLTQAAEAILDRAKRLPSDASAANALLAAAFSQRALEHSGVPAKNWASDPRTTAAIAVNRRALTVFIEEKKSHLLTDANLALPGGPAPILLSVRWRSGPYPPGYFDRLIPSDTVNVRGFRDRVTFPGIGVPLVGIRSRVETDEAEMEHYPQVGVSVPLNATVRFTPSADGSLRAELLFTDSQRTSSIAVNGIEVPLAMDFTAPLAFSFQGPNDLLVGIRNLINVGLGTGETGIYLTEPPDPTRIPVLLIHGLSSSPIVWRNVVNESMRDPDVRQNYQFWYAFYSTGAPLVYSASQIRQDVSELRKKFPRTRISDDFVIVGYSMGGVMARILITDVGDYLWNTISAVPLDQVRLDPDDEQAILQSIFWLPLHRVDQVIFIATPHLGTQIADASFAHLGAWLIRLPQDFIRFQRRFVEAMGDALGGNAPIQSRLTGLDDLSYRSPLYQALAEAPMDPHTTLHSIIGDRGRGDTPDSSDGIVGYWSSHLEQAASELIVPTGHDAQASPATERQIIRILNGDIRPLRRGHRTFGKNIRPAARLSRTR